MDLRQGAIANAPRKFCIGIDLDAIVIDLIRPWLAWYNTTHDDTVEIDHVVEYKVEKFTKKTKDVFQFFTDRNNYANCPVLPGASEALQELHDAGHDIIIVTATGGQDASLKWDLVKKAAPWFHDNDVMVGSRKERMHLDVFIDDAPKNIVKYRNKWGKEPKILTISYPYNQDVKTLVDLMALDHHNTDKAWRQICDFVDGHSRSYNQAQALQAR